MSDRFFVYILASADGPRPVLYTGVTNDLQRRIAEHRHAPSGFAQRYNVTKLVYWHALAPASRKPTSGSPIPHPPSGLGMTM